MPKTTPQGAQGHFFAAPWGRKVKEQTWVVIGLAILFAAVSIGFWLKAKDPFRHIVAGMSAAAFSITFIYLALHALTMVRGYFLTGRTLRIQRLFWTTRLDLAGLLSVEYSPSLMDQLFDWRAEEVRRANCGTFSITGVYKAASGASYQCYATDPARAIVLLFRHESIVVTPDPAGEFLAEIESRRRSLPSSDPGANCPRCGVDAACKMEAFHRGRLCGKGKFLLAFTKGNYCLKCGHAW